MPRRRRTQQQQQQHEKRLDTEEGRRKTKYRDRERSRPGPPPGPKEREIYFKHRRIRRETQTVRAGWPLAKIPVSTREQSPAKRPKTSTRHQHQHNKEKKNERSKPAQNQSRTTNACSVVRSGPVRSGPFASRTLSPPTVQERPFPDTAVVLPSSGISSWPTRGALEFAPASSATEE